jgi:Polysaccharide lyase
MLLCAMLSLGCTSTTQAVDPNGRIPTRLKGVADSGVVGNTLCLNANLAAGNDLYAHIERVFGAGAVESPSDSVYEPKRPHVLRIADDPVIGAHFGIQAIEPTDVNQDLVPQSRGGDRSRTEIKIAPAKPGMHDPFKAREGDHFVYVWRFRIPTEMKFSPSFTHIHQIKAHGGAFSDPPLITFTPLANGTMEVRHVGDAQKDASQSTTIGVVPLAKVIGQWLDVREEVTFSNTNGRYRLVIKDVQGNHALSIDRANLAMWRTGADHMRPKWGIYRKHHPSLNQNIADTIYFANFAITRGMTPSSACR